MAKRKWTNEQFIEAVKNNFSIAGVLRDMGLALYGSNYLTVKRYCKEFNLDTNHWTGQAHLRGKTHSYEHKNKIPIEKILVENSTYYDTTTLKKRLLKINLLKNQCSNCGLEPIWNDKPLCLQLEHINGKRIDNRLENLTLLCPNCHSQTSTYCGRNIKFIIQKPKTTGICSCGKSIGYNAIHCKKCVPRKTVITWPPIEELISLVSSTSYLQAGKKLGVSNVAVRKHILRINGSLPKRTASLSISL